MTDHLVSQQDIKIIIYCSIGIVMAISSIIITNWIYDEEQKEEKFKTEQRQIIERLEDNIITLKETQLQIQLKVMGYEPQGSTMVCRDGRYCELCLHSEKQFGCYGQGFTLNRFSRSELLDYLLINIENNKPNSTNYLENHYWEFANRMYHVKYFSGWLI